MSKGKLLVFAATVALIAFSVPLALSLIKARATGDYTNAIGYAVPVILSLFVLVVRIRQRTGGSGSDNSKLTRS